jgi:hypothetical protein
VGVKGTSSFFFLLHSAAKARNRRRGRGRRRRRRRRRRKGGELTHGLTDIPAAWVAVACLEPGLFGLPGSGPMCSVHYLVEYEMN